MQVGRNVCWRRGSCCPDLVTSGVGWRARRKRGGQVVAAGLASIGSPSSAAYCSLMPAREGAVSHAPRVLVEDQGVQVARRETAHAGTPRLGVVGPVIQASKNADSSRPVSFSQWAKICSRETEVLSFWRSQERAIR